VADLATFYTSGDEVSEVGGLLELLSTGAPRWMKDALCREPVYRAVNWFPERGEDPRPAQRVCEACLCRWPCAEFAMGQPDPETVVGIWGGLSSRQRRQLRAERARTAPDEPGPKARPRLRDRQPLRRFG
jgi:WhiB family redox-sensing transcriptional regulator